MTLNRIEAKWQLLRGLALYRDLSYDELCSLIGEPKVAEQRGATGTLYQLEFDIIWDSQPGGDIRVLASIDDGGWSAWVPMSYDFIVAPSPPTMETRT